MNELPPLVVVVDYRPESVEKKRTFEVLILRRSAIDTARRYNRCLVLDLRLISVGVPQSDVVTEHRFDIHALGVSSPAFVNPFIRDIARGDAIAKPFVSALVNDYEIELEADSNAGPIAF